MPKPDLFPLSGIADWGLTGNSWAGLLLASGHDVVAWNVASAASLIQESAPENVPLKQALCARIESEAMDQFEIWNNTSSLAWSEQGPGMIKLERLVTAHPFNPSHLMPLVEIFGPDKALVSRVAEFYGAIGLTPGVCGRLVESIRQKSRELSAAELEAMRDRTLIAAPKARQEAVK